MSHNWRASIKKFCRFLVLLIQFFSVALSVIFLLVYAKCNLVSRFKLLQMPTTRYIEFKQSFPFVKQGLSR